MLLGFADRNPGMTRVLIGDALVTEDDRLQERINQLIDRIPTGPFNPTDSAKITQPDKANIYGSIEGVIENFELMMWNKGWKVPIGEGYFPFESPNGELGYFIVGDGTNNALALRTTPLPSGAGMSLTPSVS